MPIIKIFQFFVLYSLLGWIIESVFHTVWEKKLVNRGFLNGPFIPIYGFGSLLVLFVLLPFKEHWYLVFPVSIILTTTIEYFTGWAMEKIFLNRWWDYSQFPLNLHGRICALFSLGWGFLCLLLVYVIDPLVRRLVSLPPVWLSNLAAALIFSLIMADLAVTIKATIDLNEKLRNLQTLGSMVNQKRSELAGNVQKRMAVLTKGFLIWRRQANQLGYIQRRLLRAFPTFKSLNYQEAVVNLRSWLARRKRRFVLPARKIPDLRQILDSIHLPQRPVLRNPFKRDDRK